MAARRVRVGTVLREIGGRDGVNPVPRVLAGALRLKLIHRIARRAPHGEQRSCCSA